MNRIEYLNGIEHRERLANMVELSRKTMTPQGFLAFSRGIEHQLRVLEEDLSAYERSESSRFCKWMGMKVYTISTGPLPQPARQTIAEVSIGPTESTGQLAVCPA